jgi:hypothetical protein
MAIKKKTVKPKDTTFEPKLFGSKNIDDIDDMTINLHGDPGSGKTFAALSASKFWPKDLKAQFKSQKKISLEDVLYVGWDRAGLGGLRQYGIDVPLRIDMKATAFKYKDLLDAVEAMTDEMTEIFVKKPEVKFNIHDTISRFDDVLVDYVFDTMPTYRFDRQTGENIVDNRATYRTIAACHRRYHHAITDVPAGVLTMCLFHQKVLEPVDGMKSEQEKQLIVKMGNRLVRTVPQMTGQAINAYTADCSLELVCVKRGDKRFLYPEVVEGQRAKNRFPEVLDGPQEAHMGKLLAKLKKVCG